MSVSAASDEALRPSWRWNDWKEKSLGRAGLRPPGCCVGV